MTKNEQIKESIQQTREKRKTQVCKVYTVKFDKSHLSKDKLTFLNMLFLEAKWLYNYQIATDNIFDFNYKTKIDNHLSTRETLINLKQAVRLLEHRNFFIANFIYKKYMHYVEYGKEDFPKFRKDWKKFLKNIKDEALKNI